MLYPHRTSIPNKNRWGGDLITFSWASTHTSCYTAVRSLGLPHIRHTTLLHVLLDFHTYVMLRCCTFSGTSTCRSRYAADRFQKTIPRQLHAQRLQTRLSKTLGALVCCCLAQKRHRQSPQQTWRTLWLLFKWNICTKLCGQNNSVFGKHYILQFLGGSSL